MKVLHTIPGLSISSGGPTTCTYHLLHGLRNQDIEADVLTFASKSNQEVCIGNDDFIKFVENDSKTPLLYSLNFSRFLKENNKYDLYHANALWTLPSHTTIKTAINNSKPTVLTPHGMLYPQALEVSKWKKEMIYRLFQKNDLERANCLQATCIAEANHIRKLNIKTPIAIIPNCIDLNENTIMRSTINSIRKFAFIGRLHPIKNIQYLLTEWCKIGYKTKDCMLYIIGCGDKEYEDQLRKFVDNNKMNNVIFTGFIDHNNLRHTLSEIDYLILPSRSENFGMVVPEALINGVPVIASQGTPWQDLNTYKCGWWYEQNELAETLLKAIEITEYNRREMGKRGQKLVVEKYSMSKVALQMKALYSWIINRQNKPEFINE